MRQQIIIPWRDTGEPWRARHFQFLVDYYGQEFDIVIGDHAGEFNRSAARNAGVKKSYSSVSVIIDADNYIPIDQIKYAIRKAAKDHLVKPFNFFGYLTEESTNLFYDMWDNPAVDFEPTYLDPPQQDFTGGAYVMNRNLWLDLGGMDEGFIGWGAEDDAFHLLCANEGIPVRYIDGYDYHLYHPAFRQTSEYNYNKLMKEYVRGNKSSRK